MKKLDFRSSQTKDDVPATSRPPSKPKHALAKKVADPQSKIADAVIKANRQGLTSVSPPTPAETQGADKRSCRRLASDGIIP